MSDKGLQEERKGGQGEEDLHPSISLVIWCSPVIFPLPSSVTLHLAPS